MLSELLADFCSFPLSDITIGGLALDSRLVRPGDLFFALSGSVQDGQSFISDAIQNGAAAVLLEGEAALAWHDTIPLISLPLLKTKVGEIAARFYGYPAKKMQMVGVTGTSGKTSCTQFLAAALHQLGIPCGIIGTLGNGLFGHLQPTQLTTPDALTLQKCLAELYSQGAKVIAMEVSSHSLDQGRVNGIDFDIGIFTNLTREHLDYHGTMENYGAAKKRLFSQTNNAVINADDQFGHDLLMSFASRKNIFAYTLENQSIALPLIAARSIKLDQRGTQAEINSPWGSTELQTPLVGDFNLSNLLAVLTALCLLNIPLLTAVGALAQLRPVPGRMQTVCSDQMPLIVVDYAHKPDALEKVLIALRQQCRGKLYCIFGCGGDRDRGKRPMMAKIAEDYADHVIVTDDNPRHENPSQIVADILQGFSDKSCVIVQHDRSKAIQDTIQCATVGDCVLIAGKGAETYQLIGDQKLPFNDIEQVEEVLRRLH